jgi:hypothetical protein
MLSGPNSIINQTNNNIAFMKKTAFYFIALACLGVAAVSCSKDDANNGNGPKFTASLENNGAKTTFDGNNLVWAEGDQVAIFGTTAATYTATEINGVYATLVSDANPGDAPYTAIYPADIATTSASVVTLPAEQHSEAGELVGFPMMAVDNTTTLGFKNLCSAIKIHMQKANTTIAKIQLVTDQYLNGDFTVDYNGGTPTAEYSNTAANHTKVTTLTFDNPVDITNGHDFYAYLPAGEYHYFMIKVYDPEGNFFTRTTTATLTFNRSEYNSLTIPASAIDFHPGDLTGQFTVNANGGKVTFSRGNLLQSRETGDWELANRQYYGNMYNNGYENYHSTSTAGRVFSDGDITNAGEGPWRCLSAPEWKYLLRTRTVAYHRSAAVNITTHNNQTNHVLLLFPDNFSWPLEANRQPTSFDGSTSSANWNGITYTYDEWLTLEDAGCVALRACGMITNLGVSSHSVTSTAEGHYWSTTPEPNSSRQYRMYFTATNTPFPDQMSASNSAHICIRLVKDVQ